MERVPAEFLQGDVDRIAKAASEAVRARMERNSVLFSKPVINRRMIEEEVRAGDAYRQARLEGRANDEASAEPGLTAFLTAEGMMRVEEASILQGTPLPESQMIHITPEISRVDLPKGFFAAEYGNMQFYLHAELDPKLPGNWTNVSGGFTLSTSEVIQIRGSANTFWQNRDFNPDGTPKVQGLTQAAHAEAVPNTS